MIWGQGARKNLLRLLAVLLLIGGTALITLLSRSQNIPAPKFHSIHDGEVLAKFLILEGKGYPGFALVDTDLKAKTLVLENGQWTETNYLKKFSWHSGIGLQARAHVPPDPWKLEISFAKTYQVRIGSFRYDLPALTRRFTSAILPPKAKVLEETAAPPK